LSTLESRGEEVASPIRWSIEETPMAYATTDDGVKLY
jgi:hypothetical protein